MPRLRVGVGGSLPGSQAERDDRGYDSSMRLRHPLRFVLTALALAVASTASAKNEDEKSDATGGHLRWARTYAAAMAEARARGCVVFATFHEDG